MKEVLLFAVGGGLFMLVLFGAFGGLIILADALRDTRPMLSLLVFFGGVGSLVGAIVGLICKAAERGLPYPKGDA